MSRPPPLTTLRTQLLQIGTLSGLIFLGATLNGWMGAAKVSAAADRVHALSRVQMWHQDADMLHDAIHATVLGGIVGAHAGRLEALGAAEQELGRQSTRLTEDLRRAEEGWAAATGRDLPAPPVDAYLHLAVKVLAEVGADAAHPPPSLEAFEREGEEVEAVLGALTREVLSPAIEAARGEAAAASQGTAVQIWSFAALALVLLGLLLVWHSRQVLRALHAVRDVADAMSRGDLHIRNPAGGGAAEIVELGVAFNGMADALQRHIRRAEGEAELASFTTQLNEAMDVVDTQEEVMAVVERAFLRVSADHPVELLLADSSRSHLERAAVHPRLGGGGCPVESPSCCMAVRRGTRLAFASSEALNACPRLRGRAGGALAAVCVPVSFMGTPIGVIHATMPENQLPPVEYGGRLKLIAGQVGGRLGTIRILEQRQLQASTDGLTGLLNRRAFSERFRDRTAEGAQFCLAIADLDHFKKLNDTYGHEAGDRALRRFAELLRTRLPTATLAARMGGEEFLVLFPRLDLDGAVAALDGLREALAEPGVPAFTASFGLVDQSMGRGLEELVRLADQALYLAKAGGRDRVVVASLQADPRVREAEPQYGAGRMRAVG